MVSENPETMTPVKCAECGQNVWASRDANGDFVLRCDTHGERIRESAATRPLRTRWIICGPGTGSTVVVD